MRIVSIRLSVNLTTPTVEQVVAKLKASHLELVRLMTDGFGANGVPEGALTPLRRLRISAEARPGAWFNDAESFKLATATAFEAREQARVS